jgi:hypothetical protein
LFYCGSLSPRKNILRILKAFNEIKNDIEHNIYFAVSQSWNDKLIYDYIDKNLKSRVFIFNNVTNEELV